VLGFEQTVSGDEVFGQLVLARIIEPTSKLDSLRVLGEAGVRRHRTRRSSAACRGSRRNRGGSTSPRRAPRTP
jgi:hypothetical protein